MERSKIRNIKESGMKLLFFIAALTSIAAILLMCVFLLANGVPAIKEIGILNFITGKKWGPTQGLYGIFPMIVGSIYITAGAILIGVPIGILTAVYLTKYSSKKMYRILKPAIELLAGIPSIVYGFFGLVVLVPFMQFLFGGSGKGVLTASVLLGIMILPTLISVAQTSLKSLPDHYYEGSIALGATHERSIFFVMIPAARSGIMAGIILGVGRAIGETMAVVMVAGNQAVIPNSILSGVRSLTANIVLEMGYAADLHRDALISTALVLFVFILIINLSFSILKRKEL